MNIKLLTNIALSLWLLFPTAALANNDDSSDPPPTTSGRSGGSRGCSSETISPNSEPALILLAPSQYTGQTVSTRPSFAWFVRDPGAWQMEFRLYQYDPVKGENKLVTEIKDPNFKSSPGIVELTISESIPALAVGQKYLWQVELVCDPSRPSGNLFAEAEIEVVQPQPILQTKLANTSARFNQAALYAEANFWYDALSIVLNAQEEPRLRELKFSLLEKVATGAEEKVKLKESPIHHLQR